MVSTDGTRISADFRSVAQGAEDLEAQARGIMQELEQFKEEIARFVRENWEDGAASEAFQQVQRLWNEHVGQLNTTLQGASTLVRTGNAELQAKDIALSGLF